MSLLRFRMTEDLQLAGMSESTQEAYVRSIRRLAEFCGKSPDKIGVEEIRSYFLHVKNEKKWAHPTCTIAICGIKFFWEKTLKWEWSIIGLVRPAREKKLSVILAREKVIAIMEHVKYSGIGYALRRSALWDYAFRKASGFGSAICPAQGW